MLVATFERLYKVGVNWKSSGSYAGKEIDYLVQVCDEARTYILNHEVDLAPEALAPEVADPVAADTGVADEA